MLAPDATLTNLSGGLIATSTDTNTNCTIAYNALLPGTTYVIHVRSQGSYGNIGQYLLTGHLQNFASLGGGVLQIFGFGDNLNTITATVNSGTVTLTDQIFGGTATQTFPLSQITFVETQLGNAADQFTFGAGSLEFVAANVIMDLGGGNDTLIVDDSARSTPGDTYNVSSSGISRNGFNLPYASTIEHVKLITENAACTVNVASTGVATTVQCTANTTVVNVGSGNMQSINGALDIENPTAFSQLTLDDSADTSSKNFVLISNGSVTNFAPAAITWGLTTLSALTIKGGSGGNDFYIASVSSNYTTNLSTGNGDDSVFLETGVTTANPDGSLSVNGQNGTNHVTLIDEQAVGQTYSISGTGLSRTGLTVTESGIQQTVINAGDGNDTFTIDGDPDGTPLNIFAGDGFDTFNIGVTSHVVPDFFSGATFDGGVGGAALTVDNSGSGFISAPYITSTTFYDGNACNYSNISTFTYDLTNVANSMNIQSTNQNTNYVINGGPGNDTVTLGNNGDASGLVSQLIFSPGTSITFNPGAGNDALVLDDHNGTVGRSYTASAGTLGIVNQLAVNYPTGLESLTINAGNGADSITLSGSTSGTPVTVNAGGGNDNIAWGAPGGTLANFASTITANGQVGADTLTVNDQQARNLRMTSTVVDEVIGVQAQHEIGYATMEGVVLNTLGAITFVNSTAAGAPVTINGGSNTSTDNVNQTDPTAPVYINPSGGDDTINVGNSGSATAIFPATERIGALNILSTGSAQIASGGNKVLTITSLSITGAGMLDMTDESAVVDYTGPTTLSALLPYIMSGYASGAWNGAGINSSVAAQNAAKNTAIGIADNAALGLTTFMGQTVDSTSILLRYTRNGNANLDGRVNALDFNALASSFGASNVSWLQGDFNFDGKVNTLDFNNLAMNFNANGSPASPVGEELPSGASPTGGSSTAVSLFSSRPLIADDLLLDTIVN